MDVGEFEFLEAFEEVGELRDWIVHFHALEGAEGAQADASLVRADCLDDSFGDFEAEARAVLDAAAPFVRSLVTHVLRELVDEVAVGSVDFCTQLV